MKAASLFSGIGVPELAMPHWQWIWCAEHDPKKKRGHGFAAEVLAHRHPHVPNLGDVTDETFIDRARAIGVPDVLVFGSPCQGFSVAGKRLGLDDPRSNLALHALRVARELGPRWIVFENVPGFLSQSNGRDYGLFLRAVEEAGYPGAWGVLDAQWWGLAQRRERLFFVGCARGWAGPAAVLLEPESLCGDHPPRREAAQDVARALIGGARERGGQSLDDTEIIAHTLRPPSKHAKWRGDGADTLIPEVADTLESHALYQGNNRGQLIPEVANTLRAEGFDASEDGTGRQTLVAFGGNNTKGLIDVATAVLARSGGNGPHQDFESETFLVVPFDSGQVTSPENRSAYLPGDPAPTLNTSGKVPAIAYAQEVADPLTAHEADTYTHEGYNFRTRNVMAFSCKDSGGDAGDEVSPTLRAMNNQDGNANAGGQVAVAFHSSQSGDRIDDVHPTLDENNGSRRRQGVITPDMTVRRLTVVECCRLQGVPDTYVHIPAKPHKVPEDEARYLASHGIEVTRTLLGWWAHCPKDGPMYAALGNAMPLPVMRWILSRLELVDQLLEGVPDAEDA